MKTQVSVEDVFGPKVHGTQVLSSAFEGRDLDFMLLFSSSSTVLAPVGQVDYVAANAFLDAFALHESSRGKNVIAVKWGIWNEVGLAAESMGASMTGEGTVPESRAPVDLPLVDAKIDADKGETVLSTLYSPTTHWLLDQHRTKGGDALIPGTGYLEIAREAAEAFGHRRPFEIRNLFFFRPLHVEDTSTKEVRVRLHGHTDGYDFEVRSRAKVQGKDGWELHAQASLLLGDVSRALPLNVPEIEARCRPETAVETPEGTASQQAVNLKFGPRWFNLRRALYGDGEALGRLALPAEYAEEVERYKLHPALVDIATGFGMDLIDGYDPSALWVPVSYFKVRYHRPMPAEVVSWVRLRSPDAGQTGIATFDVTIAEPSGAVVLEVEQFSIKRLEGKMDFAVASEPTAAEFEVDRAGHRQLSPAEEQLLRNLEQGLLPHEGLEAMNRILGTEQTRPVVTVSSMPLDRLIQQQERLAEQTSEAAGSAKFDRPDLDSEYVEPRDDVERTIVGFWEELLGVNQVGVADSFFDLGGHSLIAVRLFAKIKQTYAVDYPISVLFEAPTVERCAAMIKEAIGGGDGDPAEAAEATDEGAPRKADRPGPRYVHLVPMHKGEGGPKRPFFLVAGMFGNVLNLGHLANLIGTDRPFYGLQARGLYGDAEPHETFEEAARDYLAEVKQVQPHGPYLLGGFSGGGLTAWEMAQQLIAEGEEVAMLLLLDSRLPQVPPLRREDRVRMKLIELQRSGPGYLVEWGRNRFEWELGKVRRRFFPKDDVAQPTPTSFQNDKIKAAFYRALERYRMRHYPGRAILFRPKLEPLYVIDDDHWIDDEDKYLFHDNGFGKYADDIEVYEMPGDHDSMVLEPNVRVMARRLKRCIERAELEIEFRERNEEPPPRDPREVELAHTIRGPRDFTAA
jgi:thioesterase domain-containing protein/acyl carrier protein